MDHCATHLFSGSTDWMILAVSGGWIVGQVLYHIWWMWKHPHA